MVRLVTFEAEVGIREQSEMETLISHLVTKGYPAVLRGMFAAIFSLAKVKGPVQRLSADMLSRREPYRYLRAGTDVSVLGDLFMTDDALYLLSATTPEKLHTSVIAWGKHQEILEKFCEEVEGGIKTKFDGRRVRAMKFEWKTLGFSLSRYLDPGSVFDRRPGEELTEVAFTQPDYSSEDVQAVDVLVDIDTRQFMLRLAQLGKMRSKDAVKLEERPDIREQLLSLDLIAEEYLLTCKQDQHTICLVPSKDAVTQAPMSSLRCSVCDRSFPEENLQLIYTLTERGRRLTDGSLWMSIWITELLKKNGVRGEGIKWNVEVSGEELDIMAEDFDSRLFLELKDREFGLGDAYPFSFRINRYGGRLGAIVTMDRVSSDAKNFFEEENRRGRHAIRVEYLEGPHSIEKGIKKIVQEMAMFNVRGMIEPFSSKIGIELWPIVEHWIQRKQSEQHKVELSQKADN